MATDLQKRTYNIIKKNPAIPTYKAMILAGYSPKTALNARTNLVNSRGFQSIEDAYRYELVKKGITPKFIAKQVKEGARSADLKTRLPYLESIKKDLGISEQAPDTLIQVNLAQEIDKLAT